MQRELGHNKNYSYLLLAALLLLLSLNITYSVIFQKDSTSVFNTDKYIDLIDSEIFKNIKFIEIDNKFGKFKIQKETYSWQVISPKEFPANNDILNQFIKDLESIKVLKTFSNDEINRQSFRLNSPQVQITVESLANITLNIGLINPVDNSAYIHIKGQDKIYQISGLSTYFSTFDFSDFVNSKVFNFPLSVIESLKLYKYNSDKPNLHFNLVNGEWVDSNNKALDSSKVKEFLLKLISMNTFIILDHLSDDQKKFVDDYLNRKLGKIIIESKEGEVEFTVTQIIRKGKVLKLKDNQVFLVKASNLNFYFVINKSLIGLFDTTNSKLKSPSINKIFY